MDLITQLKEKMGYTEKFKLCKDCAFFDADMTTDNFGPGDTCRRNPDMPFGVDVAGTCNKWQQKIKRDESA
jgi:hypothetical protein